ncbi:MAG: STAS domain-containing protein [Streptosporangiaceae bacterium]|nr:STAS domain-containing protein [Streptosporangiaceae bacterium]MBV9857992.1 STAS domain-containing protein [Streptosporangiaceae bacterium]
MGDPRGGADRMVAVLPAEIDVTNAENTGDRLVKVAVSSPGTRVVVADLSATRFCDSAGVRYLLLAHQRAAASGVDIRLAALREPVLRVLELMGVDRLVRTYPTVYAALAEDVPR